MEEAILGKFINDGRIAVSLLKEIQDGFPTWRKGERKYRTIMFVSNNSTMELVGQPVVETEQKTDNTEELKAKIARLEAQLTAQKAVNTRLKNQKQKEEKA
jgi:phage terminase Nu1 subunit (DNA packaging protein)